MVIWGIVEVNHQLVLGLATLSYINIGNGNTTYVISSYNGVGTNTNSPFCQPILRHENLSMMVEICNDVVDTSTRIEGANYASCPRVRGRNVEEKLLWSPQRHVHQRSKSWTPQV